MQPRDSRQSLVLNADFGATVPCGLVLVKGPLYSLRRAQYRHSFTLFSAAGDFFTFVVYETRFPLVFVLKIDVFLNKTIENHQKNSPAAGLVL